MFATKLQLILYFRASGSNDAETIMFDTKLQLQINFRSSCGYDVETKMLRQSCSCEYTSEAMVVMILRQKCLIQKL